MPRPKVSDTLTGASKFDPATAFIVGAVTKTGVVPGVGSGARPSAATCSVEFPRSESIKLPAELVGLLAANKTATPINAATPATLKSENRWDKNM